MLQARVATFFQHFDGSVGLIFAVETFEDISIATFSNLLQKHIMALYIIFPKLNKGILCDL
jgi:hypothetical protein